MVYGEFVNCEYFILFKVVNAKDTIKTLFGDLSARITTFFFKEVIKTGAKQYFGR